MIVNERDVARCFRLAALVLLCLGAVTTVDAADIDGAWVTITNRSHCGQIFQRTKTGVLVRGAGGIVISGTTIQGKLTVCRITARVTHKEQHGSWSNVPTMFWKSNSS